MTWQKSFNGVPDKFNSKYIVIMPFTVIFRCNKNIKLYVRMRLPCNCNAISNWVSWFVGNWISNWKNASKRQILSESGLSHAGVIIRLCGINLVGYQRGCNLYWQRRQNDFSRNTFIILNFCFKMSQKRENYYLSIRYMKDRGCTI